jgi:regulatory protein
MSRGRGHKLRPDERATDAAAAQTVALALLARRDFASVELRSKLEAHGFDAGTACAVIAALAAQGLLNDVRYAENYVAYHAGRGQGPVRIAAQLRRHGLLPEVIEAALAAGPDWRELARRVCRSKFGPAAPTSWAQKARQARFLQYRGFSSDHIRAATGADPDAD